MTRDNEHTQSNPDIPSDIDALKLAYVEACEERDHLRGLLFSAPVAQERQPVSGADGLPVPYPNPDDVTPAMRAGFERLYREKQSRYHKTLERNEQGAYAYLPVAVDWQFYQRAWADALAAQPQPSGNAGELPGEHAAFEQHFKPKGFSFRRDTHGDYVSGYGAELWAGWQARAALAAQDSGQDRDIDLAFEAVRKQLCKLPRHSFIHSAGAVRSIQDSTGNWLEFDQVHALFDPIAVDAARAAAKEQS